MILEANLITEKLKDKKYLLFIKTKIFTFKNNKIKDFKIKAVFKLKFKFIIF